VSGMGSVERVLVLGIVVVIVAILGITIWGAAGEEPGAVLTATDGGVVSMTPGTLDGTLGAAPGTEFGAQPVAANGEATAAPLSEIEKWKALNAAEAKDRGVQLGNTPVTTPGAGLTVDAGTPTLTGAVPLESSVSATPANGTAASLPLIGPEKPVAAKSATPGTHTVVSGDSIWKIAHKTYGDSNIQEHIDAILAANPKVDPDNLKLGTKLTLPGAVDSDVTRQSASKQVAALDGSLYEVKKGDTLSSIAKAKLGSASKWKSIYELNRERIQDPASIKVGTTLRLPKT